jgi:hypothetical protein
LVELQMVVGAVLSATVSQAARMVASFAVAGWAWCLPPVLLGAGLPDDVAADGGAKNSLSLWCGLLWWCGRNAGVP